MVTTIPLTIRHRDWATHIRVQGPGTGLNQDSWAMCKHVRTISVGRLRGRLGVVDDPTLTRITQVLRYLLNL